MYGNKDRKFFSHYSPSSSSAPQLSSCSFNPATQQPSSSKYSFFPIITACNPTFYSTNHQTFFATQQTQNPCEVCLLVLRDGNHFVGSPFVRYSTHLSFTMATRVPTSSSGTTIPEHQPQTILGTRKIGAGTRKGYYYVQVKRAVGSKDHYLSRQEVIEEMGMRVAEWCDERPDTLLPNQEALRWSLTDVDHDEGETSYQDWTLKAIKLVTKDGKKNEGKKEQEEVYLGLDFDTNRWWPIRFCTMVDTSLQDPVSVMDHSNCELVYHPKQPTIATRMDSIDKWCMNNCGKPYVLHQPGSRSSMQIPKSKSRVSSLLQVVQQRLHDWILMQSPTSRRFR